jgi:hypothetical protein
MQVVQGYINTMDLIRNNNLIEDAEGAAYYELNYIESSLEAFELEVSTARLELARVQEMILRQVAVNRN